jgi:hypothetical protein
MECQHTLVATIDGAKVFQGHIGGEEDMKAIDQLQTPAVGAINGRFQNIPFKVTAGPHKVGVTFIARSYAESDEALFPFTPGLREERIPRVGNWRRRLVQSVGSQRYAEPQRFRVPSQRRRAAVPTRIMSALPAGVPPAGDGCRSQARSAIAREGFRHVRFGRP